MPDILVRNLDKETVDRLKKKAKEKGHSLNAEVKEILEGATKLSMAETRELVDKIRASFKGRKFSDSSLLIREDRDR